MRQPLVRLAILAGCLSGTAALAQQPVQNLLPQPRISSVFPAGGKAGSVVEVLVSGNDLEDAQGLYFAHPGFKAELIVEPEKIDPKTKKPIPKKKKTRGAATSSEKFKVTIPPDALPGSYDVRVVDQHGISNPRLFTVGRLPEVNETEPNNDVPQAQKVTTGTVVNGTIASPTDVDYLSITGKAGERFLVWCTTSAIDSRARPLLELYTPEGQRLGLNRNYRDNDALLDVTLPSNGEYLLRVSEFAYQYGGSDYGYRLTVGAPYHIDCVFPPMVPPGKASSVTLYGRHLPGGKPSGFTIDGRPIEMLNVQVTPPGTASIGGPIHFAGRVSPAMGLTELFEYRFPGPTGPSEPVPMFLTDLPVTLEADADNNSFDKAQVVPVPGEVAGRIEKRSDKDYFAFHAKKGDRFTISLFADRIGASMDTYFQIRNAENKPLSAEQDDDANPLHSVSFYDRTNDPPSQTFTVPADGKYLVFVGSREASVNFGPRSIYRLRIATPTPDFRAVVMPRSRDLTNATILTSGGSDAFDVFVERREGFNAPITFTAGQLPAGVTAKPATIGNTSNWGTLVLTAAPGAAAFHGPVSVTATATMEGKTLTRPARPATITWGITPKQNIPALTRLDQQLVLAVRPAPAMYQLHLAQDQAKLNTKDTQNKPKEEAVKPPFFVKPGDKLTIPLQAKWLAKEARANPITVIAEPFTANMNQAPITIANVTVAKDKNDAPLVIDIKGNATPSTFAVVLRGEAQVNMARDPEDEKKKTNLFIPAFTPEPVLITVLPTTLAKVTAQAPAANTLKPGTTAAITVKVDRQADYTGPFQITGELPKGVVGLTIKPVTLPAGQNEIQLPVIAGNDAKPGNINNVVITAVGTVHDKYPIPQEAKVNLTVTKADEKKK
ncbi:MAG: hypothetical protein LC104_11660 [Bacteroidales bacterium]|nr:hypothetical protein [Bacteroidales bacterium]